MIAQVKSAIMEKLTKLSGKICVDCSKKPKCIDESKCEKHKLINDIVEILE